MCVLLPPPRRRRPGPSAGATARSHGLAAGLLALGVAEMVAALTGPSSEPVVAVGDAFVDLTPPWLKEFATSTFGTSDKLVLLVGAVLVVAALCALAGVIAARRAVPGTLADPRARHRRGDRRRHPAGRHDPVRPAQRGGGSRRRPGALGADRPAGDREPPRPRAGPGPDRRAVLRTVGVVAGSGAVALVAGRLLGSSTRNAEASRASVRLPAPASPGPRCRPASRSGCRASPRSACRPRTSTGSTPRSWCRSVQAEDWKLRIHGMVDREVTLDLRRRCSRPAGRARTSR